MTDAVLPTPASTPRLAPVGELTLVDIGDIHTEAGGTIPHAQLAYQRWGEFRGDPAGRNNILLVEHALTGDSNVADWWGELLGPGKALDTDRWCVMCFNVLGGCAGSTGPASPHPHDGRPWGSRFPAINIRDHAAAEHAAMRALGFGRVHAVIGGSMGGARALEWSLLYPEFLTAACVIAVSARASAWQIGIQSTQIASIVHDPDWHGGDYYQTGASPTTGLASARRLAHLTYRGEQELDERFGAQPQQGENPRGEFRDAQQRFAVNSYLQHQAEKLVSRFDAGSYVVLTEALNRHDIGCGRGGLNKALAASRVPTMVVGVDTDILYPYHQQEHLSRNLGQCLAMAKVTSPVGHDAFLTETRQMDNILRKFLRLSTGASSESGPTR